jgi:hypothetical protein
VFNFYLNSAQDEDISSAIRLRIFYIEVLAKGAIQPVSIKCVISSVQDYFLERFSAFGNNTIDMPRLYEDCLLIVLIEAIS